MATPPLNLQRAPHHRHAAAADQQADKLAVFLLGAGLEQARPAHVYTLSDAQMKFRSGAGRRLANSPTSATFALPVAGSIRHAVERREHARLQVEFAGLILGVEQHAGDAIG